MSIQLAEKIAQAILYEGYILYPYRPSSVKNRRRWNFGGIFPQAYSQAHNEAEPWRMQTECLLVAGHQATLEVSVRFLHLVWREVGELDQPLAELPAASDLSYRVVESLTVGDQVFFTWQEAVEREVVLPDLVIDDFKTGPQRLDFRFPPAHSVEPLRDIGGQVVGVMVRQQQAIEGAIEVSAQQQPQAGLFKLTVQVLNLTPVEIETEMENAREQSRDEALLHGLVSTHAILSLQNGDFVSLLDPPEAYRQVAAGCNNIGAYPVLVGDEGQRNMMLSSPIILYDYPQIAPESPGDLYDGTEIDELLTLRILAMTDEEKQEMRQVDERARALLARTETLPQEQLLRLHGTIRTLRPVEEE